VAGRVASRSGDGGYPPGRRARRRPAHARLEEITTLEQLAREHGADFREVILLDDREAAIERFDRRARDDDDPWVRHHHSLIGSVLLGIMYDDLLEVVPLRPGAVLVPSVAGAVQETYRLLTDALAGRPGDPVRRPAQP
jgi:hypothetical protein